MPRRRRYPELVAEAGRFLARHHPSLTIPVPIERIIDPGMNVAIVPCPRLTARAGCLAFCSRDGSEIWVDHADFVGHRAPFNMTLAEEVGHILLHREIMQKLEVQSMDDVVRMQFELAAKKHLEWEAKTLAGLILVPRLQLRSQLAIRLRTTTPGLQNVDAPKVSSTNQECIRLLGEDFEVSPSVIAIRLERDGLLRRPDVEPQADVGVA
jgi:hypothetical protein